MYPSQVLAGGGGTEVGKYGRYIGEHGNFGGQKQKGIVSYAISANRQRPFAGALHAAIFNTYRRCKGKALQVVPPLIVAYLAIGWAIQRNEHLNSKAGRKEHAGEE